MKPNIRRVTALALVLNALLIGAASASAVRPALMTNHYSGKWEIKARLPRVNVARGIKNLVVRPAIGAVKLGGKAAVGAVNLAANGGKMAYNGWQTYSAVTGKASALAALGSVVRASKGR